MSWAQMSWSDRKARAFIFNGVLMFLLPLFHMLTFTVVDQGFLWSKGYWFLPLFEGLFVMVIYAILKSVNQMKEERKPVIDMLWIGAWTLLAAIYNAIGTVVLLLSLMVLSICL